MGSKKVKGEGMSSKYQVLAARYPFHGYYGPSLGCNNFIAVVIQFIKFKRQGYDIIDIRYRNIKEDTL